MVKKKALIRSKETLKDIFVSVVVALRPDLEDDADVTRYVRLLSETLSTHYTNYEIILVDNMLAATKVDTLMALIVELPCIRIVKLSRRYPHDTAIVAGLECSIGDYTVVADPVLDPVDDIPRIIDKNQESDIIQGVADQTMSNRRIPMTVSRKLFYHYSRKYIMIDVPTNATYFISLSRKAVNAITSNINKSIHIRFEIRTIGYEYQVMPYQVTTSPIRSRNLRVGLVEAIDIISSYSLHPLRFMSWVGLLASVVSIGYAVYVLWVAATQLHVAEGWTTMSLQISGLFFFLFLIIVVLAEYIGKLLLELRPQSRYHVVDEMISAVSLADVERKNLSKE